MIKGKAGIYAVLLAPVLVLYIIGEGFAQGSQAPCGVENCHGTDMVCGSNVVEACTAMYKLGDFCREFARCMVIEGKCQLAKDPPFDACVKCVRACEEYNYGTPMEAFKCEDQCRQKIRYNTP